MVNKILCFAWEERLAEKSAVIAFFLGATAALPGEVFSSMERFRTFFIDIYDGRGKEVRQD